MIKNKFYFLIASAAIVLIGLISFIITGIVIPVWILVSMVKGNFLISLGLLAGWYFIAIPLNQKIWK